MSFAIRINEARHGWLYMELWLGEQKLEWMASDVLNDPVRELAELALFIASGDAGARSVNFWLEPQGYELCATYNLELKLKLLFSDEAYPSLWRPKLVTVEIIDRGTAAREILRCLRAAQPLFRTTPSPNGRVWNQPFPDAAMARLEAMLT